MVKLLKYIPFFSYFKKERNEDDYWQSIFSWNLTEEQKRENKRLLEKYRKDRKEHQKINEK